LQYQSSGVTALLLTAAPAFTVILAHYFLPDEPLTRRTAAGVALAVGGAAALVLLGESGLPDVSRANPLGYALVITAIFSASAAAVYARRFLRDLDAFEVSSVRIWSATAVTLPVAYWLTGLDLSHAGRGGYAALIYAGLAGTFGAMLLEFRIIQRFGATATAMAASLIPIVALIGGRLFLDERITAGMVAAMALIISGVLIITRSEAEPIAAPVEN
jgi:drug/metabolite transporter (DMT)-like permease